MRRPELAARASWLWHCLWSCLSVALAGCSAVVEPDVGDLGPRPAVCKPGDLSPFTCPDSAIVNQVCNEQGGFDPAPPCPPPECNPGSIAACRCGDGSTTSRLCLAERLWPSCPCATGVPMGTGGTGGGTAGMLASSPGG